MQIHVFIATSLDGKIARTNDDLNWLTGYQGPPRSREQESQDGDLGYTEFMSGIDTIVMGRKTYETILGFEAWPFREKRVIVRSSQPRAVDPRMEWSQLDTRSLVSRLEADGAHNVYIDGGKNIQDFLREDLVDTMILTVVPILIGEGIPLFGSMPDDRLWHTERSQGFHNGMIQCRYVRTKRPSGKTSLD